MCRQLPPENDGKTRSSRQEILSPREVLTQRSGLLSAQSRSGPSIPTSSGSVLFVPRTARHRQHTGQPPTVDCSLNYEKRRPAKRSSRLRGPHAKRSSRRRSELSEPCCAPLPSRSYAGPPHRDVQGTPLPPTLPPAESDTIEQRSHINQPYTHKPIYVVKWSWKILWAWVVRTGF